MRDGARRDAAALHGESRPACGGLQDTRGGGGGLWEGMAGLSTVLPLVCVKAKVDWNRVKAYALVMHGIALVASYIGVKATIGVYGWTLVVFFGCGALYLLASMAIAGSMMGKEPNGRGEWPAGAPAAGGMGSAPAADDGRGNAQGSRGRRAAPARPIPRP